MEEKDEFLMLKKYLGIKDIYPDSDKQSGEGL